MTIGTVCTDMHEKKRLATLGVTMAIQMHNARPMNINLHSGYYFNSGVACLPTPLTCKITACTQSPRCALPVLHAAARQAPLEGCAGSIFGVVSTSMEFDEDTTP